MIEKLYTVEEVAELASVTGRTIRNYLKSGRLVGRKIGGQWRFPEAEVQRLLNGGEPEPAEEPAPEPQPEPAPQPAETQAEPAQPPRAPSNYNTLDLPEPQMPDSYSTDSYNTETYDESLDAYEDPAPPQPEPQKLNGYYAEPAPAPAAEPAVEAPAPAAAYIQIIKEKSARVA